MVKILIIEDEPDVITVMRGLLENESHKVNSAIGGEKGIEKIGKEKPDLILLDIRMPQVSGRAVLEHLKTQEISIPVIVVTAVFGTSATRNELVGKYHIDGFVNKTRLSRDLINEINRVLSVRKK